jgi:uncharacterized protein YoxC
MKSQINLDIDSVRKLIERVQKELKREAADLLARARRDVSGINEEMVRRTNILGTSMNTSTASLTALIATEQTARISGDTALATDVTVLFAQSSDNAAEIDSVAAAFASADAALAADLLSLTATVDDVSAAVDTISIAYVAADSSLQSQVNGLDSVTDSLQSQINSANSSITAVSASLTTLTTQVAGIDSSVDILAAAYIVGGAAVATWGFKLDAGGKVVAMQAIAASGGVQPDTGVIIFSGADLRTDNYSYGVAGWFLGYDGRARLADAEIWGTLQAGRMSSGIPRFTPADPGYEGHTYPTSTSKTTASKFNIDSGPGPVLLVHYKGWRDEGAGFSRNRYGPNPLFSLKFSGVVDHYVSLWWRHRWPDGSVGGWVYVPDSEQTEPAGGSGSVSTHADFTPTGLDGDVGVEFGVRGTNEFGSFLNSGARDVRGALSVQVFNDN